MTLQAANSQPVTISLRGVNKRHPHLSYSWWTKPCNEPSQPKHYKIGGKKVFYMNDVLAWEESRGKYRSHEELLQAGGSL